MRKLRDIERAPVVLYPDSYCPDCQEFPVVESDCDTCYSIASGENPHAAMRPARKWYKEQKAPIARMPIEQRKLVHLRKLKMRGSSLFSIPVCDYILNELRGGRTITKVLTPKTVPYGGEPQEAGGLPLPRIGTFMGWLGNTNPDHKMAPYFHWLREGFEEAGKIGTEILAAEILDIVDDADEESKGAMEKVRARVKARQWMAERINREKFAVRKEVALAPGHIKTNQPSWAEIALGQERSHNVTGMGPPKGQTAKLPSETVTVEPKK